MKLRCIIFLLSQLNVETVKIIRPMAVVNPGFIGDDGKEVVICVPKLANEFFAPTFSVSTIQESSSKTTQGDCDCEAYKKPQITAALAGIVLTTVRFVTSVKWIVLSYF